MVGFIADSASAMAMSLFHEPTDNSCNGRNMRSELWKVYDKFEKQLIAEEELWNSERVSNSS